MTRGRKADTTVDREISDLASRGLNRGEIAQTLAISRSRLNGAIKRLDLRVFDGRSTTKGHYDTQRAAEMARLYKDGLTLQGIGSQFGVSRERVRQILRDRTEVTREDGGQAVATARSRAQTATKRDQAYMAKLGCGWTEYKRIRDLGRELIKAGAPPCKAPMKAFLTQKRTAGQRGIG
jgi:DNA-binding CsgD family transcriptional regulator